MNYFNKVKYKTVIYYFITMTHITINFDNEKFLIPISELELYPNSVIYGYYDSMKITDIKFEEKYYESFKIIHQLMMGKIKYMDLPPDVLQVADKFGLINENITKLESQLNHEKNIIFDKLNDVLTNKHHFCIVNKYEYMRYHDVLSNNKKIVPFQLVIGNNNPFSIGNFDGVHEKISDNICNLKYLPPIKSIIENRNHFIKLINIYDGIPICQLVSLNNKPHNYIMKKINTDNIKNNKICVNNARYSMLNIDTLCPFWISKVNIYQIFCTDYNEKIKDSYDLLRVYPPESNNYFTFESNYVELINNIIKIIYLNEKEICSEYFSKINNSTVYGFIHM